MADEDLPPPLEDMTDVIKRISQIKAKVDNQKSSVAAPRTISSQSVTSKTTLSSPSGNAGTNTLSSQIQTVKPKQQTNATATSTVASSSSGFCGMKKGFLSGGLDSKKSTSASTSSTGVVTNKQPASAASDSIPLIKANPSKANDHLVMQEVQKMRDQLQKTDAWLTEDLLNKLGNNDKLMNMMADPRCEQALQEFQTNPDKALVTYQNDKYIQEFFKEFCDVLGNHYENLHDASVSMADTVSRTQQSAATKTATSTVSATPPTTERKEELLKEVKSARRQAPPKSAAQLKREAEEEARVKQVLSNPQLIEILQSPNIMELIRCLKEDPEQAQKLLQQGGKEFQQKVRMLVDAGLLAFQR